MATAAAMGEPGASARWRTLRKLVAPAVYLGGGLSRRVRAAAREGVRGIVFGYHRVGPPGGRGEEHLFGVEAGIPVDAFEVQLRFLLRHFRPVRVEEILEPPPPDDPRPGFAITFDDGYADDLTLGAPVLQRLGVPATIFVTTGFAGTDRLFWWEELGVHLRAAGGEPLDPALLEELLAPGSPDAARALASPSARARAHHALSQAWMTLHPDEVDRRLDRLAEALGRPRRREGREAPLLTWEQVRAWTERGFGVGAHTVEHPHLGRLAPAAAAGEVRASIERVRAETGRECLAFAYPYGGPEHCPPVAREAAREAGCRIAVSTDPRAAACWDDAFLAPRAGLTRGTRFACAFHVLEAVREAQAERARAAARARAG